MAKVAVVFHSGYGHTLRMAQVVAEGADAELVAIDAEVAQLQAAIEKARKAAEGDVAQASAALADCQQIFGRFSKEVLPCCHPRSL